PPITPDQRPQPLQISMEIVHMREYMPHGDGVEAILPEREKAVQSRELHLMVGARYLPCRFVRLQTGNLPAPLLHIAHESTGTRADVQQIPLPGTGRRGDQPVLIGKRLPPHHMV